MEINTIIQPSYRERIEAVRREVQAEIVKLFQDNGLTEVRLLHTECEPVSVMWFNHDGNAYDTAVVLVLWIAITYYYTVISVNKMIKKLGGGKI